MSFLADLSPMLEAATSLFNSLFPILIVPLGVLFASGLLMWLITVLLRVFNQRGGMS